MEGDSLCRYGCIVTGREMVLSRVANSQAFLIKFKFEVTKNLKDYLEFKFFIFNFSSSSSSLEVFTEYMLSFK